MSDGIVFGVFAVFAAGVLFVGLRKGFMPTYLTGGASRLREPTVYWIATVVWGVVLLVCIWAAVAGAE